MTYEKGMLRYISLIIQKVESYHMFSVYMRYISKSLIYYGMYYILCTIMQITADTILHCQFSFFTKGFNSPF